MAAETLTAHPCPPSSAAVVAPPCRRRCAACLTRCFIFPSLELRLGFTTQICCRNTTRYASCHGIIGAQAPACRPCCGSRISRRCDGIPLARAAAAAAARAFHLGSGEIAPFKSSPSLGDASKKPRDAAHLGSGEIAPLKSSPTLGDASKKPRDAAPLRFISIDGYDHVPVDVTTPTEKDLESDEALWAFYKRWCKAFNKERDYAEMARRFKIFRCYAKAVYHWNNTRLPSDPKQAAIFAKKRRQAELLISRGEDAWRVFDDEYLPMELGLFADGGDPVLFEHTALMLKELENEEQSIPVEDVTADQ